MKIDRAAAFCRPIAMTPMSPTATDMSKSGSVIGLANSLTSMKIANNPACAIKIATVALLAPFGDIAYAGLPIAGNPE